MMGTRLGWTALFFLVGIVLHSLFPYDPISPIIVSTGIAVGCLFSVWPHKRLWIRWCGVLFLAVCVGVWRFETIRPTLPFGLQPLTAKGLARVRVAQAPAHQDSLEHWIWMRRNTLRLRIGRIFPPNEASLLRGILYGERDLSKEWQARFRRAGLLHIIAVSGSNMTIIVVLVAPLLLLFGCSRRGAFFCLSGLLIFFVIFVQPSASVVRAALMGWLLVLAPVVGRIARPSRLLLIAAVVFVGWKPWALLYDAGFALSFLAMWGLLTWSVYFDQRLIRVLPWTSIRTLISTTLGATLMTLPYLAWAFGQVSLFSVIGSLLVVPLVPWIMGMGVLAILCPQISIFVLSASGFLSLVFWVARVTDALPTWMFPTVTFPVWAMGLTYYLMYMIWSSRPLSTDTYPHSIVPRR